MKLEIISYNPSAVLYIYILQVSDVYPIRKMPPAHKMIEDFRNLAEQIHCPCSNALRHVIWEYYFDDVLKHARGFRDPVILGLEYRPGSRLFMATSRSHVFHYLCFLRIHRPEYATWHEIFSGLTPQRLYFDLDFYYGQYPGVDVDYLAHDFRDVVNEAVARYLGWNGGEGNLVFLDLDATTAEKFSHHLIFHIEQSNNNAELVFTNGTGVKNFVHQFVLPELKQRSDYYLRNGEFIQFMDTNVYADKPGRNFRLLGSPKFGHQNVLRVFGHPGWDYYYRHQFEYHDPDCRDCERQFFDCLVSASNRPQNDTPNPQLLNELYFLDDASINMNGSLFCTKGDLYYEIRQFEMISELFPAKLRMDLLNDLVGATKRSEYYDRLYCDYCPTQRCIELFRELKNAVKHNPVDWDHIYGLAADLLKEFNHYARYNESRNNGNADLRIHMLRHRLAEEKSCLEHVRYSLATGLRMRNLSDADEMKLNYIIHHATHLIQDYERRLDQEMGNW